MKSHLAHLLLGLDVLAPLGLRPQAATKCRTGAPKERNPRIGGGKAAQKSIAKAIFLGLALAFASHTEAATIVVKVSALIDGRDQLILQGNTLQWHHFDFAAVGRHEGRDEPTLISTTVDGVPVMPQTSWTPVWSTPPPDELYSINTFSSVFDQLNPTVPRESSTTSLNILSGYSTVIVQSPSASNGFTTILEFNDNPLISSQQYTVEIVYRTVPELSSAGMILLGGAGIGSVFRRKQRISLVR